MKSSEADLKMMGIDSIKAFFEQWGPLDEHSLIVLDYIFESMYKSEGTDNAIVHLPSSEE